MPGWLPIYTSYDVAKLKANFDSKGYKCNTEERDLGSERTG